MNELTFKNIDYQEFHCLLPEIAQVYLSAYEDYPQYSYHSPKKVKRYLTWLYKGDPKGFFVAFYADKVIGFVSAHAFWEDIFEGEMGEIHELAVDKRFQGKGVGKILLQKAIAYIKEGGQKRVGLWVGVENEKARNFYQKMGFVSQRKWGEWERMLLYL
jgi:ribosomal protein S18 acetylase RimI-like enzyme